jgi:flavin-binding protein dodecin
LNGLMMAVTSFMRTSISRRNRCHACVAEVTEMDMKVENGKVIAFRTRVALSFKYES